MMYFVFSQWSHTVEQKGYLMSIAITICFLVTGVINFIPLVGVLSKARLETLYGLSIESNELTILLKHRAVL